MSGTYRVLRLRSARARAALAGVRRYERTLVQNRRFRRVVTAALILAWWWFAFFCARDCHVQPDPSVHVGAGGSGGRPGSAPPLGAPPAYDARSAAARAALSFDRDRSAAPTARVGLGWCAAAAGHCLLRTEKRWAVVQRRGGGPLGSSLVAFTTAVAIVATDTCIPASAATWRLGRGVDACRASLEQIVDVAFDAEHSRGVGQTHRCRVAERIDDGVTADASKQLALELDFVEQGDDHFSRHVQRFDFSRGFGHLPEHCEKVGRHGLWRRRSSGFGGGSLRLGESSKLIDFFQRSRETEQPFVVDRVGVLERGFGFGSPAVTWNGWFGHDLLSRGRPTASRLPARSVGMAYRSLNALAGLA